MEEEKNITGKKAKEICLEINPKLKCVKHRGCVFYSIIEGVYGCHKPYSGMKDTPTLAWKDCYKRLLDKQ